MTYLDCDVLVVGAGPAGLSTAVAAARHGARVILVERRADLSPYPRATGLSTRTVEILRSWGLEEAVRVGAMDVEPVMAIRRTLADPPVQTVPLGYPSAAQLRDLSPVTPLCCPQDHVERVLLRHLRALGVEVRFGCAPTASGQDADGVYTTLSDGSAVRSRFLVGADGARSTVRGMLGIGVEELGTLADFLNVQFRADLDAGGAALHVIAGPRTNNAPNEVLLPTGSGRWTYARQVRPGDGGLADWTADGIVAAIRGAVGVPDLALVVDAVFTFSMTGALATGFRAGTAFLVGDAAHRMTPMGGTGMNTAVHAAHDLGWRLAFAARGLGGEALLDGYEADRRPIGRENVLRSLGRGGAPGSTGGLEHDLGVGYGRDHGVDVLTAAAPGARAPHVLVEVDGRAVSTLDLFGGRFTLLTGADGAGWRVAADVLAAYGVPITALSIGDELRDVDGGLVGRYGLGDGRAVLVRPDGHCGPALADVDESRLAALTAAVDEVLGAAPVLVGACS